MKHLLLAFFITGVLGAAQPKAEDVEKLKTIIVSLKKISAQLISPDILGEQENDHDPNVVEDMLITSRAKGMTRETTHLDQLLLDVIVEEAILSKAAQSPAVFSLIEKALELQRATLVFCGKAPTAPSCQEPWRVLKH